MEFIMNLSNIFVSDVDKAGQRAVDMAELSRNHVKVPLCFVLSEKALESFVEHNRIKEKGAKFLGEGNYHGLQDEIISSSLPSPLIAELTEAYQTLAISEKDGAETIVSSNELPYVNVLLSPNYRTNGEIVLNVKGLQELGNAIKQVWAMLFSQESFEERESLGVKEFFSGIIIQRAPQSRASADVTADNTANVLIETYFGYPDLSNKFVKDYFEVSKESLQIVKHEVKHQNQGWAKDESGNLIIVNMSGKGSHQKVDDKIVIELGRLGKKINTQLNSSITASFTIDKAIYLLSVDRVPDVVVDEPDAEIIEAAEEELAKEDVEPAMETDDVPELDDDREESLMPEQEEEFLTELEQTTPDEDVPSTEPAIFDESEAPQEAVESFDETPATDEFDRSEDALETPEELVAPEEPSFDDHISEALNDELGETLEEPTPIDEIPATFEEPEVPEEMTTEMSEAPKEPEFSFDEPKPEETSTNFEPTSKLLKEKAPVEKVEAEEPTEPEASFVEPELSDDDFKPPEDNLPDSFDDSEPEEVPDSFDETPEKSTEEISSPWKEEIAEIDEKVAKVGEIKDLIHDLEEIAKSGDETEVKHKINELHDAVARLKYQS